MNCVPSSTLHQLVMSNHSVAASSPQLTGIEGALCAMCLDKDIESSATYEVGDFMYCQLCYVDLPQQRIVEATALYITTAEQVLDLAAQLEANTTYVLDLETTGLNPRKSKVITIALGTASKVWTIDVRAFYRCEEDEKMQWKEALQRLLHQDNITWAGHNLKFDWSFLVVHFDVKLHKVYDTMLVEKLIHNGEQRVSASLLNTAGRYGITVTKEERNWFIGLDERFDEWTAPLPAEQLRYIEQDIKVPHQVMDAQQPAIEQQHLQQVIDLENRALPSIAALEVRGIVVDVGRWQGILLAKLTRKQGIEAELQEILGNALAGQEYAAQQNGAMTLFGFALRPAPPKVNLGSSQHLIKALGALGIRIIDSKAETLEAVKGQHEIIEKVLEWKELEKFISAFGESLLQRVESDGKIHATFEQLGAVSGRIICRDPNLQQIPKPPEDEKSQQMPTDENLRSCFIAPPGYKLLVADLSNIELRILAEASGDETMLRFFAEGQDLHSETAKMMFNLPPDTNTKKHLINGVKARNIAKAINFGLAYGMGPTGLAGRINVDIDTAKKLMQTYFNTYKGVDAYLKASGRNGVNQGYAASLSGRRRSFQKNVVDRQAQGEIERAAKNHPIQGTNADILKRALALLFERLPDDVHVVLTVHDELVLEAPIVSLDIAEKLLKESMMDACRDFLKKVAIPEPDVLIEDYWVKG